MNLEVTRLSVAKNGQAVLHDVSCAFAERQLTVVIGPNGAGKSTLLRSLAGLEHAAAGKIILGGRDVTHAAPHLRSKVLTWIPAESEVPFAFTARECVVMGRFPWHRGTPRGADYARADQALDLLGMTEFAARVVPSLSSGERLKVQIARALAGDAHCLLFDEPTANLDVGASLHLLGLLKRIAAEGRTVGVSLHDLSLARRFADRAICLEKGRVFRAGAPSHVFDADGLRRVFGVSASPVKTPGGADGLLFDV